MRTFLPLLLLLAGCAEEARRARDGSLDGLWRATSIDGDPVGRTDFLIRIRGDRVVGGKDGCNAWAYDMTEPPAPDGTRLVLSAPMECPGIPARPGYWRALGNGNAAPALTNQGEMRLRAGGSEILASRAALP